MDQHHTHQHHIKLTISAINIVAAPLPKVPVGSSDNAFIFVLGLVEIKKIQC